MCHHRACPGDLDVKSASPSEMAGTSPAMTVPARTPMTFGAAAALAVAVFATSFLSGIFGLAGGLVLMGMLLLFLPVTTPMVLHAITQMASNGSRAFLWRRHADRGI